jgi:hypothetical protein
MARRVIVDLAKPGGGKVRPKDKPQDESVDSPDQQHRHCRMGELLLQRMPREHRAQGELAREPQTHDGKSIQQPEQPEIGERAHAVLGNRVWREAVSQAGEGRAQDRLDRQGCNHRRQQSREEVPGASAAGRAFVQRLRQALYRSVRLGHGGDDLKQPASEVAEHVMPVRILYAGRDCGLRRGCRALSLEFVGHCFLDRLDKGVELLLREGLRRCRWRLGETGGHRPQQEGENQRRYA